MSYAVHTLKVEIEKVRKEVYNIERSIVSLGIRLSDDDPMWLDLAGKRSDVISLRMALKKLGEDA